MALKDLQSDLSWYGKKSPGPWTPSNDRADSKFKLSDNVISVRSGGYSFDGTQHLSPITLLAADSFQIDNVSLSDRGAASRKAQLGNGTTFPIGPEGQIHQFDKTRTGFSSENKYSDSYGVKFKNAGLADTYTANSPIDDMYGKFNLREDSHDPFGYAKPPFILRGIQREGSSDPQRWGTAGVFDIPRGGVVTAAQRAAVDAARIGKFLIRPAGLVFLAKQIGLQLSNPNLEGKNGLPNPLGMTKLYDPISSITNAVGGTLGLRTDRHFPPLVRNKTSTYEGIHNERGDKVGQNRLVLLKGELIGDGGADAPGGLLGAFQSLSNFIAGDNGTPIQTLTALTGPKSLLGIGSTTIRRYINTTLASQKETGLSLDLKKDEYHQWKYEGAYESTRGESGVQTQDEIDKRDVSLNKRKKSTLATSTDNSESTTVGTEKNLPEEPFTGEKPYIEDGKSSGATSASDLDKAEKSLKNTYTNWPTVPGDRGGRGDVLPGGGINERKEGPEIDDYKRMSYGDIPKRIPPKGNKDSRQTNHFDFRDNGNQSQALKIGWDDRRIDSIDGTLDDSLIKFKIGSIKFKAYLGSLNETFVPGWNGEQDQGRADSRYLYQSFERTISTDFIVPIYSEEQREPIWNKLQSLARITYPVYGGNGFYGQSTKLTIGDMYKNKDVIITDLSYDWDAETPWEITDGKQAPFYTNVSIGFTMLDSKPQSSTKIYGNI